MDDEREIAVAPCGCKGWAEKWCGYDTVIVTEECEQHRAQPDIIGKRMFVEAVDAAS